MVRGWTTAAGMPGVWAASKGGPICVESGACPCGRPCSAHAVSTGSSSARSQGEPVGCMRPTTVRLSSCASSASSPPCWSPPWCTPCAGLKRSPMRSGDVAPTTASVRVAKTRPSASGSERCATSAAVTPTTGAPRWLSPKANGDTKPARESASSLAVRPASSSWLLPGRRKTPVSSASVRLPGGATIMSKRSAARALPCRSARSCVTRATASATPAVTSSTKARAL